MRIPEIKTMINENGKVYLAKKSFYNADGRKVYNDPEKVAAFFADAVGIKQAADEHLYTACFDSRLHLIACFECSHGTANCSLFPVRETFQKALLVGAVSIAICHNHPGGSLTPSEEDINATRKLKEAGKVIGIELIDHIILAANNTGFYSFATDGNL